MEIKIGLVQSPKELVVESAKGRPEVLAEVKNAVESGHILQLEEANGRIVLLPANQIAYVDISATNPRPIGFGAFPVD